jgi:hypothetical protein
MMTKTIEPIAARGCAYVNPDLPYFLEHSVWAKPYIAGFYAKKYLKKDLSREAVEACLDTLLALERRA